MDNPRLAGRYAKSLIDLATEQGQLDIVCNDMKLISAICKSNPDFVTMLRSPIIKGDKKGKIIAAITKSRISPLSSSFIQLLVNKSRETNLPEIADVFIDQFNKIKNIHKVKISAAVQISDDIKQSIVAKVKAGSTMGEVELETIVKDELIGGFILETEDRLIDASVLRDLRDVKKQFLNNDYIHKLR